MTTMTRKSALSSIDMSWNLLALFAVVAGVSMLPEMAHATNALEQVFCNLVNLLTGPTGKAVATIAIIAVGVGALLGKISWGMAMIVAIGVALVFGAATIVNALGGSTSSCAAGTAAVATS